MVCNTTENLNIEEKKTDENSKPKALPVLLENIPQTLKDKPQWVLWRYEFVNGRWTKVPYNPRVYLDLSAEYKRASSTDPKTWGSFKQVAAIYTKCGHEINGIGFILKPENGIVGIDLDNSKGSEQEKEMLQLGTYVERSPSNNGLRLFGYGSMPNNNGRKNKEGLELYNNERFLTITGQRQNEIEDCKPIQDKVDGFLQKYFPAETKAKLSAKPLTASLEDEAIVKLALDLDEDGSFDAYWHCKEEDIPKKKPDGSVDRSVAVCALCWRLAYYTRDPEQIERLVDASAWADYDKWKTRPKWRAATIQEALDKQDKCFVSDDLIAETVGTLETDSTSEPESENTASTSNLANFGTDIERNIVSQILASELVLKTASQVLPPDAVADKAHQLILEKAYAHLNETGRIIPVPILKYQVESVVSDWKSKSKILGELNEVTNLPANKYDELSYNLMIVNYAKKSLSMSALRQFEQDSDFKKLNEAIQKAASFDLQGKKESGWNDAIALKNRPRLEWQIEGHFPTKANVTVYGTANVGKSFFCLDLALSIAYGVPFLDKWKTKQGTVLYICSEGEDCIIERLDAWLKAKGLSYNNNILFSSIPYNMRDRAEVEHALKTAKVDKIDAVFVDTLSRSFGGGDSDKNVDMQAYMQNVDFIRNTTGATVVSVHHTGNADDRRERGAKTLRDSVDTSICLYSDKHSGRVCVSCEKQRSRAKFDSYLLDRVIVEEAMVYKLHGTKSQVIAAEKEKTVMSDKETILSMLPEVPLDTDAVFDNTITVSALISKTALSQKKVYALLEELVKDGVAFKVKIGNENRNNPYRYYKNSQIQA